MTDGPQHGQEINDLWAWIDQDDESPNVDEIPASDVVAVMVVHDAEEWLPRQLLSLARLDPRPGRIIAVDTGSEDGSAQLLDSAHAEGVVHEVLRLERETSFGAAVAAALGDSEPAWIWLLHDDSAPHRDALGHLLEGARHSDVVVPKLLEPKRRNYPETLSEIGQAITPGGLRVPLVETGDIDQHQSESRDVLGASTAGLLIRGETWREVGGIAPEVERHRDGVDFGWRANAIGYRVLTWPEAALNHHRAGSTGLRPSSEHPHVSDRLAALRVAGARGASGLGLGAASLARALGFLLAKSPSTAAAELKALGRYRSSREATRSLATRLPDEDMTPDDLLPNRFWPVRHAVDRLGAGLSERYRSLTDTSPDTSIDELTSDEFSGRENRGRVFSPVTLLVVLLILASAVSARSLLGGDVSGGGLLAAPASLGSAWEAYLSGRSPWLGFAAVTSVVGFASPNGFAILALVLTPLLAALSALALLRRLGVELPIAAAASAAWAGGTILLGLVTAGDVTGMVLAVTAPLLARSIHSVVVNAATGAERLRAPAGAAFWLVVVASVWPAALLALTLAGVVWAARNRDRIVEVAVVTVPAWLFLIPALPTLARYPGRLLTGVDPLAWPDYPPASYALVVGRILPSGLPLWTNLVFFGVLGLAAVVSIAKLRRRAWVWSVLALATPLIIGTLLSRLTVAVDGGVARPLLSPWALLVLAALLAPVVWRERDSETLRRIAAVAVGAVALLAVVVWAVVGFAGPVQARESVLPGFVRDVLASQRDPRALALSVSSESRVTWNVIDRRQPQWGTGERNPVGSFDRQLTALAYSVAAGDPPADLAERLQQMGVSHLYLGDFEANQRAALDNLEGLVGNPASERSAVWTVSGLVSRASLGDEFLPTDELPAGEQGRRLTVAESASADWTATVDGERLPRGADSERPLIEDSVITFDQVPAEGGTLELAPTRHWWQLWLHLVVMAALALLAAPTLGGSTVARRGQ